MKRPVLVLCLAAGCTDGHNLGDTVPVLGQQHWTVSLGALDLDQATAVAIDSAGDVIAGGLFRGVVDFGNGPLATTNVSGTGWISKRSIVDGSSIWSVALGTPDGSNVSLDALATDAMGNVIIVGQYMLGEDFGGTTLTTQDQDGYIAKYDGGGHLLWARGLGPRTLASVRALSLDIDGNSYVAGTCYGQGQIAFPGATASCADASTQGFVAKYGPDGTAQWGRFFPSIDTVVVTADGTIAATATIDRTQMFGSVAIAATSTFTPVALRLSPTGDLLWAKPYGDPGLEYLHGPAIVNARGDLLSATTIGRAPSTQLPQISALDESGAMIWRAREQAGAARIGGLAGLADGTTVSAGTIAGYVADFGGGTIAGTMFVAAYADDGSFRDARAYGMASGNGGDEIAAIATSTSGAIAFVANVIDAVDFGTGPVAVHAGASNQDIVIGMIAPPH